MENQNPSARDLGNETGNAPKQDYSLDSMLAELIAALSPHQRAVLGLYAISHCYDMPLAPMLSRLAGEASGDFGRQTMYLAALVHQGMDPVDAIQGLNSVLTSSTVLALQVARDDGSLPKLYRAVLQRSPGYESDAYIEKEESARISRLWMRGIFVMFTIGFIMLKVVPEFMMILNEFGAEPPAVLVLACVVADWICKFWFLGFLLIIPFGFWWGRRCLRRWNPVTWRQPVISKAARSRRSLAVMYRESDSQVAGLAKILQCLPLAKRFFPKFLQAQSRVEAGQASWDSLAAEGVITKQESKALAGASSGETQAWLLRWTANTIGDRVKTRSGLLVNIVVWLGNIVLALVVLLICVAILTSLISMMECEAVR